MADKKTNPIKQFVKKFSHDQEMGARRTIIEEMFNDYYKERRNIYKMNFFRGIFFGLGTFLGGTIVVALMIWLLSLFANVPGIGDSVQKAQQTLQQDK